LQKEAAMPRRHGRIVLLGSLLCLAGCAASWVELPPMPTARHDLEAVAFDGKLYAISGADDFTLDVVEVYDLEARSWSKAAPIPEKRGWFGCALMDGKAYCVGGKRVRTQEEKDKSGDKSHYEYRASLNVYDLRQDTWATGPPLAEARAGLKAAACAGKLYALGGNTPKEGGLARVDVYDPRADTWTPGPPLPEGRMAPGVATVGGKLYVIGGWKGKEKAGVLILDPTTGTWSAGAPMPTARRDFATVVLGRRIWCIGGVSFGEYSSAVDVYDTKSDTWRASLPIPTGKAWMGACALDGKIYVAGGANYDTANKRYRWLDEFHVYDP